MTLTRQQFLHLAAGAAALPVMPRFARAQSYPTRPVRLIVGFPAGGVGDVLARLMGQWLSDRLGQPFVIENRPGAATNIATEAVVRAAPDGHTLLWITAANTINASLYDKLSFNFIRDITPVASVVRGPGVMEVNPAVPAKTIPEFIAYAKANPGKINLASSGPGTVSHVAGELFKIMAGIDMVHVPYRGAAPALTDLISGQVQVMILPDHLVARTSQGGTAARAGRDHRDTTRDRPGHPDRGRVPAGLRRKRLDRHRRPARHAGRDRRQARH